MENDPELKDMPKDSDGSAKIALIAIDHSIIAWAVLSTRLPELHQTSLHAMLTLDRLRRAVEKDVPNARPFVRPGFDTVRFPREK
jgi:acyl dehydratase